MSIEYIHTLLNKYWNCESSVEEEQILKQYFSNKEVPIEFEPYIPLFRFINEEHSITPGNDFDERLKEAIQAGKPRSQYITVRLFTPMLRAVASFLLIIGLGISLFFIVRSENKPHFAETYHDPNAAIKDATYALIKLSDALQVSEEVSLKTLQFIDKLEIDWSSLDSLSNKRYVPVEIEKKEIDQ